jgi:hypothetical protein
MAQKLRVRGESDLKPGFHGHHRVHCAICKCASYGACHHLLGRKTLMAGISNPGHPKCPDPPPSWIPVNESSWTSVCQSCHRRALIQWLLGTSKFPTFACSIRDLWRNIGSSTTWAPLLPRLPESPCTCDLISVAAMAATSHVSAGEKPRNQF